MGQYAGSDIVLESNSLLRAVFFIPKNKERQVTVMRQAVTTMQYVFAGIGGFMGWFLGGLDGFLYALLMFVVIDYATGLMAAFVQKLIHFIFRKNTTTFPSNNPATPHRIRVSA